MAKEISINTDSSYTLNGTTKIKVVGMDKGNLTIEFGGTPSLTAQLLK